MKEKILAALAAVSITAAGCGEGSHDSSPGDQAVLIAQGKEIFRSDTFGDEIFWSDKLRMHEVIAAAVDPITALSVGLNS